MKKRLQTQVQNKSDILYTPKSIAINMIDMCELRENEYVLDPSKGGGVFYDNYPEYVKKEWCEIAEGKNFFDCVNKFDWVIGNPPYSMWDKWLEHTMAITENFCYIFGFMNFTPTRIHKIQEKGFVLTKLHLVKVDWWMSQSIICVFQKKCNKEIIFSVEEKTVQCHCGRRCGRGRNGRSYNECVTLQY